jgi:hypothetical protein
VGNIRGILEFGDLSVELILRTYSNRALSKPVAGLYVTGFFYCFIRGKLNIIGIIL